ncbi:MAG: hypothetical protein PHO88_07065 [Clostridia bacterium]|nr:hypothetical protein [Clostridia bacterium]
MKECDILKCPKCNRYFIEPPAIYIDDDRILICSKCGIREALEYYRRYKEKVQQISE